MVDNANMRPELLVDPLKDRLGLGLGVSLLTVTLTLTLTTLPLTSALDEAVDPEVLIKRCHMHYKKLTHLSLERRS